MLYNKNNKANTEYSKDINVSLPISTTSLFQEYDIPNLGLCENKNNFLKTSFLPKIDKLVNTTNKIFDTRIYSINKKNNFLSQKDFLFLEEYEKLNLVHNIVIMYKGPKDFIFNEYLLSLNKRELLLSKIPKGKIKLFKGIYFSEKSLVKNNAEFLRNLNKYPYNSKLSKKEIKQNYKIINHPILYLNFDYVTCKLVINNQTNFEFIIMVLNEKKIYNFRFHVMYNNHKTFKTILLLIQRNIVESKGYINNLLNISLKKNFYKCYFIKELEFQEKANTGDILIFKGFKISSKCQRFFTRADYDHVALLIRKDGILYVYESTSDEGCNLRPWKVFIENIWNLLYDKMAYRELMIDADNILTIKNIREKVQTLCEEFLNFTKNKKYYVSLKKILCGSHKKEKKINWEEKNGFSCSALVFSAFIKMGIVPNLNNVDEILPGDFSQDSNMIFNKNFSLSPEYIIDFN